MSVEVVIEAPEWERLGLEALAERAVPAALIRCGHDPAAHEVVVLGCADARISELNESFRGRAGATNVLSWPSAERGAADEGGQPAPATEEELGDIALAVETCLAEAEAAGRPATAHVLHLLVHGTLHLLGYDHERQGDADLMETLEVEILASLGVPDPYSAS